MKRVAFHLEAEAELVAAAKFYEVRSPGLGFELIAEITQATHALAAYPRVGRRFSRRLRRVLVRRFPFSLLYRIESDEVLIVAVAHVRRRPGFWRRR